MSKRLIEELSRQKRDQDTQTFVNAVESDYFKHDFPMLSADPYERDDIFSTLDEEQIDRVLMSKSFKAFIPKAWETFDPAPYLSGWHIDCIAEYMEAVFLRQIRNLIINIPPRHMKSSIVSVNFPAWGWTRDPKVSFMCLSYAEKLAIRDSVKCRRLIESAWYQKLWGTGAPSHWENKVILASDQNQKGRYENTAGGTRLSSSVGGTVTGEGAHFVIVDDAHNVVDAESDAIRNSTVRWWEEAIPSRLNTKDGCKVIIQQRVHDLDLAGEMLQTGEYEYLVLPAEYEPTHPYVFLPKVPIPPEFTDSRKYKYIYRGDVRKSAGELLWPARFDRQSIDGLKRSMGEYAYAGQYQQSPSPRRGGMFKEEWFRIIDVDQVLPGGFVVRGWDLAASEEGKHSARTVGVKMKAVRDGDRYVFFILDIAAFSYDAGSTENAIISIVQADGDSVDLHSFPQDPGQAGKQQRRYFMNKLVGYPVRFTTESGDKTVRARPLSAQFEIGNIYIVDGPNVSEYIQVLTSFPKGRYKDHVDATSRAFSELIKVLVMDNNGNNAGVKLRDTSQPESIGNQYNPDSDIAYRSITSGGTDARLEYVSEYLSRDTNSVANTKTKQKSKLLVPHEV